MKNTWTITRVIRDPDCLLKPTNSEAKYLLTLSNQSLTRSPIAVCFTDVRRMMQYFEIIKLQQLDGQILENEGISAGYTLQSFINELKNLPVKKLDVVKKLLAITVKAKIYGNINLDELFLRN